MYFENIFQIYDRMYRYLKGLFSFVVNMCMSLNVLYSLYNNILCIYIPCLRDN